MINKNNAHRLLLLLFLIFSCGCNFVQSDRPVHFMYLPVADDAQNNIKYENNIESVTKIINELENKEKKPEGEVKELGELYAVRSVMYARSNPTFRGSKWSLLIFNANSFDECYYGSMACLMSPFFLVYDLLSYPVDLSQHLSVTDEEIVKALQDAKRARELGFESDGFPRYFEEPIKLVDTLGYKLEDYETTTKK